MTRHDITKTDRDLINLGVTLGFTDAVEVACDLVTGDGDADVAIEGIFAAVCSFQHDRDMTAERGQWFDAYNARCAANRAAMEAQNIAEGASADGFYEPTHTFDSDRF